MPNKADNIGAMTWRCSFRARSIAYQHYALAIKYFTSISTAAYADDGRYRDITVHAARCLLNISPPTARYTFWCAPALRHHFFTFSVPHRVSPIGRARAPDAEAIASSKACQYMSHAASLFRVITIYSLEARSRASARRSPPRRHAEDAIITPTIRAACYALPPAPLPLPGRDEHAIRQLCTGPRPITGNWSVGMKNGR